MTASAAASLQGAGLQGMWAKLWVDSLVHAGVKRAVVSPGSRSTPLVWALGAANVPVEMVIDERAAAFFALGVAKATGEPVLVVATSGSAPAHWFPAVLEAEASHVPLVLVSADRPLSLQHTGSNQTLDQVKLFGDHVRWFADLGAPEPSVEALRMVKRVAGQAVMMALGPVPGPVHVNARFRKPLEPVLAEGGSPWEVAVVDERVRREGFPRWLSPELAPRADALDGLVRDLERSERPLLVVGPMPLPGADAMRDAAFAFAARAGFVLHADPLSQLRYTDGLPSGVVSVDAFDALLRGADRGAWPDLVVEVGQGPVSGPYERWLGEASPRRWVLAGPVARDPMQSAAGVLVGDVTAVLQGLTRRVEPRDRSAWQGGFRERGAEAWRCVTEVRDGGELSEGSALQGLVEAAPEGAVLVVGNSLAPRTLETWTARRRGTLRVVSQRGTSGIDGLVAGAAGVGAAVDGPVALILGDLSLLHDVGSLELLRRRRGPLVVLVVNNDGGRIFETLPVADADATRPHLQRWTTPHGLGFEHAARLFGLHHVRVTEREALDGALRGAFAGKGPVVVEVVVPPGDARARLEALRARLLEAPSARAVGRGA